MDFKLKGLDNGPVLVCIPGLLGGPEDFDKMLAQLGEKYTIVIVDPNSKRRLEGGLNLNLESMNEISYDPVSLNIKDLLLKHFPDRGYYFLGISIGGKVVFDFASKFPELFFGGIVTDVGPTSFNDSQLFTIIESIVENVNLNLTFSEIKKSLQALIPDKNLRLFVQTQVSYPNKTPPAVWKSGIKNFANLLKRQSLDDQEESYWKVDSFLAQTNRILNVMHADHLSGIAPSTLEKMKTMKSIKLHEVPNATHFLQISHTDLVIELTLGMLINKKVLTSPP